MNWGIWLRGLVAAFIGGGSGGATAGFTAMGIDPDHFNLSGGLRKMLLIVGATFLVNGVISMLAYLKQSPLPKTV